MIIFDVKIQYPYVPATFICIVNHFVNYQYKFILHNKLILIQLIYALPVILSKLKRS